MTPTEKLAALRTWQAAIQRADTLTDPIVEALQLIPESPFTEAVWGLQDALTAAYGQLIDDAFQSMSWFAHENNFGAGGREAGPAGAMRPIRTLEDLLWLIEVSA